MKRLLKSRDYLMNYLGLLLLIGFISLGAIGGCNNSEGAGRNESPNGSLGDSGASTTAVSSTTTCTDIPTDASCFRPSPLCESTVTGGGCDCEYVGDDGKSLGPAPISLSIPTQCDGNVEVGAPCSAWECICYNATDDNASISATAYVVCLD